MIAAIIISIVAVIAISIARRRRKKQSETSFEAVEKMKKMIRDSRRDMIVGNIRDNYKSLNMDVPSDHTPGTPYIRHLEHLETKESVAPRSIPSSISWTPIDQRRSYQIQAPSPSVQPENPTTAEYLDYIDQRTRYELGQREKDRLSRIPLYTPTPRSSASQETEYSKMAAAQTERYNEIMKARAERLASIK
ncbi:hypothetical protein EXVG_00436 [Emiliania huxleyi virus 202]|nr:hypothetical protein EXVG_00436 [Emiliania huxleyi virus 202]AHA54312.1 hypothetical protein EhV18_00266 [Emiliania huxleyi virus 18]AHA55361.1 hypothetical protein EhV156_00266 [Emiliania huxleyi virus 156]